MYIVFYDCKIRGEKVLRRKVEKFYHFNSYQDVPVKWVRSSYANDRTQHGFVSLSTTLIVVKSELIIQILILKTCRHGWCKIKNHNGFQRSKGTPAKLRLQSIFNLLQRRNIRSTDQAYFREKVKNDEKNNQRIF